MKTASCSARRCGNVLRTPLIAILLVLPGILAAQDRKIRDKNEELGPVGRTSEIINVMSADLSIPPYQFSFFHTGNLGIYTGEPYYDQGKFIMLPSGAHTFLVAPSLVAAHSGAFTYEAPDNAIRVDCVLEPGKFYTFKHDKMNSIWGIGNTSNVSVVETNVIAREGEDDAQRIAGNFREFVEYYMANPGALEGMYTTKNGKSRITFAGDRFTATIRFSQSDWVYEGTFRFNGDTIIARVESQMQVFGKNKKIDLREDRIWSYKVNGDVLDIDGRVALGSVKGSYTKTAE